MQIAGTVVLVTGANRGVGRAFAPVLKYNGGGAIVNMLSIAARVNLPMHGRDGVTLADERASQRGTQTST